MLTFAGYFSLFCLIVVITNKIIFLLPVRHTDALVHLRFVTLWIFEANARDITACFRLGIRFLYQKKNFWILQLFRLLHDFKIHKEYRNMVFFPCIRN